MTEFNKPEVLGETEQFNCSLISKFPYCEVEDVISEACCTQRDDTHKKDCQGFLEWVIEHTIEAPCESLLQGTNIRIPEPPARLLLDSDWQEFKSYVEGL